MIKDNQKMLNWLHVFMDACIVAISYVLSYYLRFYSPLTNVDFLRVEYGTFYPLRVYASWLIFIIPMYLLIYYFNRLYTPKRGKRRWLEVVNIIVANTFGITFFTFILYLRKEGDISRQFLGVFYGTNIVLSSSARLLLAYALRVARRKGYNLKHILLVGYSRAAESYIDRILANPQWGYYIHGILDDF